MSTLTVGTISEKVTDAGVAVDGVTLKDGGATFTSAVGVTGNTTITSGNLVIGTSGNGIDFSAVSGSASGSSSALLDDYEEGTWTPTFVNFNETMTIHTARYTKIARLVTYELKVTVPSTADGDAFQYTLPFTPTDNIHGAFCAFQQKGLEILIEGTNVGRHRLRDFSGNNRTFAQFSSSVVIIVGFFSV